MKAIYQNPAIEKIDQLYVAEKEYPKRDPALKDMPFEEFYKLIARGKTEADAEAQ